MELFITLSCDEAIARVDQSMAITLEAGVGLGAMPLYFVSAARPSNSSGCPTSSRARARGFWPDRGRGGLDAGATRTRVARRRPLVINGSKQFITNSGTAITSLVTVTAVTGERMQADGTVGKELRRSSCRRARLGLRWSPHTTRSGGTRATRIRSRSLRCASARDQPPGRARPGVRWLS